MTQSMMATLSVNVLGLICLFAFLYHADRYAKGKLKNHFWLKVWFVITVVVWLGDLVLGVLKSLPGSR